MYGGEFELTEADLDYLLAAFPPGSDFIKSLQTGQVNELDQELFGIFKRGGYSSRVNFFDHLMECTKIRLDNKQNKFMVLFTIIIKFIFNHKRL